MPLLPLYKKKQGLWIRWGSFLSISLLWLFAAYRCYISFPDWEWAEQIYLPSYLIPLVEISLPAITPRFLISFGIGAFLILITGYLSFQHNKASDFLIDTESEMRKVSWPTVKEVVKSSTVVIITIFILALYLYFVDIGLDAVFKLFFFS